MIDVRFESLESLRFKGVCFVIDFRCESIEATIFMGVSCLIDLFLRQAAKHQKKCGHVAMASVREPLDISSMPRIHVAMASLRVNKDLHCSTSVFDGGAGNPPI